jgi:hypothetical protein
VIARDHHHRRAVVGVELERLGRELLSAPVSFESDFTSASAASTAADLGISLRFWLSSASASPIWARLALWIAKATIAGS